MELKNFANKLTAANSFIKASFGGFAGSGKSRTASEFIIGTYKHLKCDKPILIIDNEKGSRFLIPMFKKAGIETFVKDTVELADVLTAFELLNKGEISFLFIDSLTKVWYKYTRDYRLKNNKTFMSLQDWGKILPAWQETFADRFVELEGNCVFTGRGGYTYDMEENDKGKKEFVKSGVKMKMAGETPFEPDLNVWMEISQEMKNDKPVIWREGLVMKDRSGLIDGMTFKNPTFKNFEPVIQFLLDVPKGEVKGATSTQNIAPSEEWSDKKRKREIILEEITNSFVKMNFGTAQKDKQIKLLILEKIFQESSWKAIEVMALDALEIRKIYLLELFEDWKTQEDKENYIAGFKPSLNFD